VAVKKRAASRAKPKNHNLVVIELADEKRRIQSKPHLYVLRTQRDPEHVFETVKSGDGPKWISGSARKLRSDLVPNYRPTNKLDVANVRLDHLKTDLARDGYAVNGDTKTWRVYVLDVDLDVKAGAKNVKERQRILYVGQTSTTPEKRLSQHQGKELSKKNKHIGSPKLKNRKLAINKRLTPQKIFFTKNDAVAFETQTHKRFKALNYLVLGDTQ